MNLFRLPVSGIDVTVRQPAGAEDVLLLEAQSCDIHLALAMVARLAAPADGSPWEWGAVCITDIDALLLTIRRLVFGDWIRADTVCQAPGCGARIDISFRVSDYLAHHAPRMPRGIEPADAAGYFRIRDTPVRFRLPTGQDQAATARLPYPERVLVARCIQPTCLSAKLLRRVEAAMEALAPSLCHEVEGQCPECGDGVTVLFDPQQFCLLELRNQAAFLYEEVHCLAASYHWSEAQILALPRVRRNRYAEMARQERRSA